MSGSPLKTATMRAFKEALLNGEDPVKAMVPYAERLKKMALEGDLDSSVTLGAIKEAVDRIDGKVAQEISVDRVNTEIDASLLGNISELLKLAQQRQEKVVFEEPPKVTVKK